MKRTVQVALGPASRHITQSHKKRDRSFRNDPVLVSFSASYCRIWL